MGHRSCRCKKCVDISEMTSGVRAEIENVKNDMPVENKICRGLKKLEGGLRENYESQMESQVHKVCGGAVKRLLCRWEQGIYKYVGGMKGVPGIACGDFAKGWGRGSTNKVCGIGGQQMESGSIKSNR